MVIEEMKRPVLTINTYAGSLLVGAKAAGHPLLMSLEDHGYGVGTQRLNFPALNIFSEPPWPVLEDLNKEIICLAHPPCSCFSLQSCNQAPQNRGLDSDYFKSTRTAIEHALTCGVAALAVESVVGTLEGARSYHDEVAAQFGYQVYRILQNSVTFGLSQWRPRFWAIFIQKDNFTIHHRPWYRTVGNILENVRPGDPVPVVSKEFQKLSISLMKRGIDMQRVLDLGPGYLTRRLGEYVGRGTLKMDDLYPLAKEYGLTTFSSCWPIQLDPGGFTHTLMRTSHWWYEGRALTAPEYNALAGFPADYQIDSPGEHLEFLSRGVAPPVAKWILQQVEDNLNGYIREQQAFTDQVGILKPGETIDLRISRAQLKQTKVFNEEGV